MPAPLPRKIKELRGTLRKSRINHFEPEVEPGAPEPPDWLYGDGLEEWNRVVKLLGPDGLGVISRLDRGVLAVYCLLWQLLVEGARGERPQLKPSAIAQFRRAASSLGLDAMGRIRLRPGVLEAGNGKRNPFSRFQKS